VSKGENEKSYNYFVFEYVANSNTGFRCNTRSTVFG